VSSNPRVIGVVPAWTRGTQLAELLASVAAQTRPLDALVVVDNDASADARAAYAPYAADVVTLAENAGAVGGFREGISRAWQLDADAVWLLDDDSVTEPGALAALLAAMEAAPDIGGAAPTVCFADGRRYTGWLWGSRTTSGTGHEPAQPGTSPVEIDWAPFAGLLLRREACHDAGDLRRDLFLWHADVEYCLRVRRAGWKLVGAPAAVVHHPVYALRVRRLLGRTFTVRQATPWQEYEDGRNWALLIRELRGTAFADGRSWFRRAVGELGRTVAVLGADPGGVARVRMRMLGLADGWRARPRADVAGAPPAAKALYASAPEQ
jgi:GT2 family glycosyltransferase